MRLAFRESSAFSNVRDSLFGDDDGFRAYQEKLSANPTKPKVIPGTGGVRKDRWKDPKRGKGKRGGIRVIYYYIPEASIVLLMAAYDKNTPDLTPQQKKLVAQMAKRFHDEVMAHKERWQWPSI